MKQLPFDPKHFKTWGAVGLSTPLLLPYSRDFLKEAWATFDWQTQLIVGGLAVTLVVGMLPSIASNLKKTWQTFRTK